MILFSICTQVTTTMASSIISISASSSPLHLNPSLQPPIILHSPTSPPPLHFSGGGHLFCRRRKTHRGMSVVTRGAPGASTYIFAFVFPLSLLAVTIFTSIRIADKLDQDFLEELAINQSILEEAEEEDFNLFMEEEAATPRTRNRPKREAASEPSSSV